MKITALLVVFATGFLAEETTSRVLSDIDIHIASRGVGEAIYIGPCRVEPLDRDVYYFRLVDSSVEADLTGYLVSNEDRADIVFCTD